jgi:predicted nucleotidyltransferase
MDRMIAMGGFGVGGSRVGRAAPLGEHEHDAVDRLVARVRRRVPAHLERVVLFGSRARGTARPDSDIDLLLIFRELTVDREPQATQVERIADDVHRTTGVPLGPWSVSRIDLRRGLRTPMLVDALADGVAIWPRDGSVPRIRFTPEDALRCSAALLDRVEEGSEESARRLRAGDARGAVRRARDDIVRLCTADLLLDGETRPRRGDAVHRYVERHDQVARPAPLGDLPALRWTAASFGPRREDEEWPFEAPPGGFDSLATLIDRLTVEVEARRAKLGRRIHGDENPGGRFEYEKVDRAAGRPAGPGHPHDTRNERRP